MNTAEFLQISFDRINKPGCWTRSVWARDKQECPITPESPDAVAFCSVGTLYKTRQELAESPGIEHIYVEARKFLMIASEQCHSTSISRINDRYDWATVKTMWHIAITLAKGM